MEKVVGLSQKEVEIRLRQYGLNVLPESPPIADRAIFLRQFASPLVYILLLAAIISAFLKDWADALIIMLAVLVNTVLGFYQERKAERGLLALKRILTSRAKVERDGRVQEIEVKYIVPGEMVILTAGDRIPADGIVIEAAELSVNEATLTGESLPVVKTAGNRKWQ